MRRIGKGLSAAVLAMAIMLSCSLLVFADTAYITTSDGGSVNMRAEASTDSDVVNFLDDGTEVEVLGTEGDWTQVSYDGYTGYVMSTFLTTEAAGTATDTEADTAAADTAADTTTDAADDTAADTQTDTSADDAADDTTVVETEEEEEEIEAEISDDEDTTLSEKLAKYKKLVMILALACLILVIIIINLLLFYRRGYDDDEYDDEDDDDEYEDEDDRYYESKHGRYEPEQKRQTEPVKQQTADVPDISGLVNDTAAEAYGEAPTPSIRQQTSASVQDDDDGDLEFFDLDDL